MTVFNDTRSRRPRWRYAFMENGLRYTGSAPASDNTKRAAQIAEREHQARIRGGITIKTQPTVREFIAKFLEYQASHARPGTIENQTIHLEQHVIPRLGKLRLDTLKRLHVDELKVLWAKQGAAPRTVNGRLDTIRRMLAVAEEWGYLAAVPRIKAVKVPKDTPRYLTGPEAALLLTHAEPQWRSMILIGLRTGLRIGEIRGLQWGDLDERTRSLQIRRTEPGRPDLPANGPKGGRERTIPLTPDALACLLEMRPADPPRDLWIWPALLYRRRPGEIIRAARGSDVIRARSTSGCFHGIRAAVIAAGLPEPTPDDAIAWHTLRHTFASWLVLRGEPLTTVQTLLGHASVKQTERYSHLAPNLTHHRAVAALDFALDTTNPPLLGSGTGGDE